MSLKSFFAEDTHQEVVRAVQAVESVTSTELVVVVRVRSGRYAEAHGRAGSLLALVTLFAMLYVPEEFPLLTIPLNCALAYLAGWAVARYLPPVERFLTSRAVLTARTRQAALTELVDGGITATTGRTGLLVYVSALEKEVHLVGDLAVEKVRGDQAFQAVERKIIEAGRHFDPKGFIAALHELGPALAGPLPVSEGDVNELEDGVRT